MEKITSIWRDGYDWRIRYRYYLDKNDLWINFNDLCEFMNIESVKYANKYFDKLPDYNKRVFEDNNTFNNRYERGNFINKAVFDEFVAHELERCAMLKHDIEILENELGLNKPCSGYNWRNQIDKLVWELSKKECDINKTREYYKELINTPEIQMLNGSKHHEELIEYAEWLESDEEMFIAHKENNEVHTWQGPSIDEALDILFNAGKEEI